VDRRLQGLGAHAAQRDGRANTPPRFGIRLEESNWRCTLILQGELDLANAPRLERVVTRLCSEGAKQLVLDLSRLDFMDAAGLHAVLAAQSACREFMLDFGLIPGRGPPRRLLHLTGVFASLPIRERPGETVAGL
jgi:anti-anti-sigma factor